MLAGVGAWWYLGRETPAPVEPAAEAPRPAANQTSPTSQTSPAPAGATKDRPFENSLGMKFVPVPGTNVLFCIHETRWKDYEVYAKENPGIDGNWRNQTIDGYAITERAGEHPVIRVSWHEAQDFCAWLSKKEGKTYRLPTDEEWSLAVGFGSKTMDAYPWGTAWPPPPGSGNYSDQSRKAKAPSKDSRVLYLEGYDDGFPTTSPVMSFPPNRFGLHDMGGNVWEWVEDRAEDSQEARVRRGGSWANPLQGVIRSARREAGPPSARIDAIGYGLGFRIVLAPSEPTPSPAKITAVPATSTSSVSHYRSEGRFRAWSAIPDDPAIDLSKLAGIDEVKQVLVHKTGWVVLTPGGRVVSNRHGDGAKGIEKLCQGWFSHFGTIDQDGRLTGYDQRGEWDDGETPEDLGPVADAYLAPYHRIALLRDGTVRVWGMAYDGKQGPDDPEWPKPQFPAGRKAVAISIADIGAAVKLDDGSVHIFHAKFAPMTVGPEQSVQFSLALGAFFGMDKAGSVGYWNHRESRKVQGPFLTGGTEGKLLPSLGTSLLLTDEGGIRLGDSVAERFPEVKRAADAVKVAAEGHFSYVAEIDSFQTAKFFWVEAPEPAPATTAAPPPAPSLLPELAQRLDAYLAARRGALDTLVGRPTARRARGS